MARLLSLFLVLVLLGSYRDALSQTYFLNGDAQSVGGDCYQLTSFLTYQGGTVWYADQIDLTQNLDIQFQMNFGTFDSNGADGICFVLQTIGTNAQGTNGGGLGYEGFGTSLGIEFDTYQNGDYGDPSEDHIAIQRDGDINHNSITNIAGPIQADVLDVNIEDGEDHIVRIVWDAQTHIIQVYFDCVFRLSAEIDLVTEIFSGQNLVYWGFTASTGGLTNIQTVCLQEDIISQSEQLDICSGLSTTLQAGASGDGVYTWTPSTYLSDASISNPLCSAPVSTTYTVTYNDICNEATTQTIVVNVDTLEVTVNAPLINCNDDSPSAIATSNLALSPMTYTWTYEGSALNGISGSTLQVTEPGNYSVTVNYANQCVGSFDFIASIDTTTYSVNTPASDVLTCIANPLTIQAAGPPANANVQWFLNGAPITGENDLSISVDAPGAFSVQVIHPVSGCISNSATDVGEDLNTPTVSAGPQDSLTCVFSVIPFQNIVVGGSEDYSVQWSTTNGQLEGMTNSVEAYAAAEGVYEIIVTDLSSGCSASAEAFVFEASNYELDLSDVRMPNIISPNGDSKNERWVPFIPNRPELDLSGVFETFDVLVYDRWGKLAHESKSVSDAFQANEQPDGVYYYIVHYTSACGENTDKKVQGYVHVHR